MGISQHTRFENHINIASTETMGDAEKISDYYDEDPYDDDFEAKLSQIDKNIVLEKNASDTSVEYIEEMKDSDSTMGQDAETEENGVSLALNPTLAPFKESEGIEWEETQGTTGVSLSGNNMLGVGNTNHHQSVWQAAEKIVTITATIDAVSDILSGGVAAVAQPNRASIDEISPQIASITNSLVSTSSGRLISTPSSSITSSIERES